jgi:sugar phosphate permease
LKKDEMNADASEVSIRARRRVAQRIVPFVLLLYIVAFLDRVNVAYAGLEMTRNLGFNERIFGLGAGIFFIGYLLFGIPGALRVERWSARRWIASFLISWGLVTVLMNFVKTPTQFYGTRFFPGAAEAGFFPGIIVYLTHWFLPTRSRQSGCGFDDRNSPRQHPGFACRWADSSTALAGTRRMAMALHPGGLTCRPAWRSHVTLPDGTTA